MKGEGAVIVAHPDDETLWAGSFIAEHPGITVICCTVPRLDPDRALRFFDAVRELGGFPVLIPFLEPSALKSITHLDVLNLDGYDYIVTHNANGEYGHQHHKDVHAYVMSNAICTVYTFGYNNPSKEKTFEIEVTPKKWAALKMYDNQSPADGGKPKWMALMDTYDISKEKEVFYVES